MLGVHYTFKTLDLGSGQREFLERKITKPGQYFDDIKASEVAVSEISSYEK